MVISPIFPPAVGGIESLTAGLVDRWDGPVHVHTLEEPGSAAWDAAAPYPVSRVRNVPRGGRKSIARLTAATLGRARQFRPEIVFSTFVRCGYAAALARQVTGAAWLQHYHAREVPTWPRDSRFCARHADQGIAVSHYTQSLVESIAPDTRPIAVIPPGIPIKNTTPGPRSDRPTLLTISRVNDAYKGHDVVLDALPLIRERIPAIRWVIVGGGDRLPWLRRQVHSRGLEGHVEIRGIVDDDTRDQLLADSDLFVLPSRTGTDGRTGEGFGIVYAEAAAAGLPIVAGNHGGVVDAVQHGISGLLIDPTDPGQLAKAVTSLLLDPADLARMSVAARSWSERFLWDRVANEFRELALSTLERVGRRRG
ncbi:glycosyltransferase family 4 protein [Actinoplanes sp. URMC 104]|uniref:glycosyltransferase family 4 protein n=1 Tax=Actinoplanes sp. URMC 104 TaxID=3423409 RepID=UPI003F1AF2C8